MIKWFKFGDSKRKRIAKIKLEEIKAESVRGDGGGSCIYQPFPDKFMMECFYPTCTDKRCYKWGGKYNHSNAPANGIDVEEEKK